MLRKSPQEVLSVRIRKYGGRAFRRQGGKRTLETRTCQSNAVRTGTARGANFAFHACSNTSFGRAFFRTHDDVHATSKYKMRTQFLFETSPCSNTRCILYYHSCLYHSSGVYTVVFNETSLPFLFCHAAVPVSFFLAKSNGICRQKPM